MPIDATASRGRVRVAWPIAATVTWVGSIAWAATQIGIGGVGVGLASSIVLTVPIVAAFVWLDRWKRERPRLLLSAFAWGAGVATFCSIWSQQWLHALVDMVWGAEVGAWLRPLVITPVTEEVLKGLFLVWLLMYRRREVIGVLDGIVYAGMVGAGFSFTENSLYLGRPLIDVIRSGASDAGPISVLGVTVVMRLFMVPFFHSLMAALTGIGVGLAANSRRPRSRVLPVSVGLSAAIVLHGTWDWAGLASSDPYLIFRIYGSVMVPVFLAALVLSVVLRNREARLIAAGVPILIRSGDVTPDEVASLTSLRVRGRRRAEARRSSAASAARELGRYHAEASALALRIARDRPADRELLDEQRRVLAEVRGTGAPHRIEGLDPETHASGLVEHCSSSDEQEE